MEQTQKEHIIKNIGQLQDCTVNENVWYNELLEKNILTPSRLEEIRQSLNTNLRIRKTYLECLKTSTLDILMQSLKNSQNVEAVNILEELSTTSSVPTSSKRKNKLIWFGIQSVTKHYEGRGEELQTIHNCWLEGCSEDTLTVVYVTGLGGIGKSELARKYAYKFNTLVQGNCIWINAESETSFTDSLHKLAQKIGISLEDSLGKRKTIEVVTFDVFNFLSTERLLVVFDNLENYEEKFFKYFMDYAKNIPPMRPKPFVLLTSRYQLVHEEFGFMVTQLKLSVLQMKSAVSYFENALNVSEIKVEVISDLHNLCQELDCLPLAMQQAAAYINEMKRNSDLVIEIQNYVKIFKREAINLMKYPVPKYQNRDSFSKPTYLTWQITLDKFKHNPKFYAIITLTLNIISFFQSENIAVALLRSIIELAFSVTTDGDMTFYDGGPDVFETLRNYSMVEINELDNEVYISVHRLVQGVSQIKLKEENHWAQMLNMLLEIIHDIFENTITTKEMSHISSLLMYTEKSTSTVVKPEKFFNLLEQMQHKYVTIGLYEQGKTFSDFAVRQIKDLYGDKACQTLRIISNHVNILLQCGELTEAELLINDVYLIQLNQCKENVIGEMENHDVLQTKTLLSQIYYEKGHYDEALKIYLEVLEVRQRVLSNDHPSTLTTRCDIAGAQEKKGNYDEALKIYLGVLEIRKQILGIDHYSTLKTKQNVAATHLSKGNYDEALKMLLEVLEDMHRVLGNDHPDTLTTMNNIAGANENKGNYDEALKLYLEVLEVSQKKLGNDHPSTLSTKDNIALTLERKGNYDQALEMYSEVLEDNERVLGIDHPKTLTVKDNIAGIHESKGNYDEALKMYMEILKIRKRVLGSDHPDTLTTKNNIAMTQLRKGNYNESLPIFLEALEASERVVGIEHPDTLTTKNNIALIYERKGYYNDALKLFIEVLKVWDQVVGSDNPKTLATKSNIAMTYKNKGNYNEALKIYTEVLEVRQRIFGAEHPSVLTTKNNIAMTHQFKGDYDRAIEMFTEALKSLERVLGAEHPNTLTTKNNIAFTYLRKGNYDEACKVYSEILKIKQRVLGVEHPDTLTTKYDIAGTLRSEGKYDEALQIYLEVLEAGERVFGIDDPKMMATKNNIALTHEKKGNYNEALIMYWEVLEARERVLGIEHSSSLITKSNIAGIYIDKGNYNEALKVYLEVLEVKERVLGSDHRDTLSTKNNIAATLQMMDILKTSLNCT